MDDSNQILYNSSLYIQKHRRDVALDVIRVIACLMIVLMHSPMPGLGTSGAVLSGISYLTASGIGLFFMVSGALLLKVNAGKPFETKSFLRKRFTKILIPLVFGSLVGWGLEQYGIDNTELGVLWFMYCLAGIYLLTPILSRWLSVASKKEIEFYLLLWLVTLCVPFVKIFFPVNESDTSWLYYFHGYVGYYVLGFYLIHILVMRNVLWKTEWMQGMNGIVQIVVCTILTFIISALISWGISKIKYARTIIGY